MRVSVAALIIGSVLSVSLPATAQAEDSEELVRLPGQGQGTLKTDELNRPYRAGTPSRLVPGGGLMISFDVNDDGRISPLELEQGAQAAFAVADENGDGSLTALEQQDWSDSLPTRDGTLANPVRFDPNLDRMVSAEEFTDVIRQLADVYAEKTSGDIIIADLKAKPPKEDRRRPVSSEELREQPRRQPR